MTDQALGIPSLVNDLALPQREGGYSKGHETRELILRTALSVLIEEGYRAMSMRRVAAECGMKFGNLTYHYRTREDLVRELLDAVISSYEAEFAAISHRPDLSPDQRFELYCLLVLGDITSKKSTIACTTSMSARAARCSPLSARCAPTCPPKPCRTWRCSFRPRWKA